MPFSGLDEDEGRGGKAWLLLDDDEGPLYEALWPLR